MSEKKPAIKGAKLVGRTWVDSEGQPLTNADLIKLRNAALAEQAKLEQAKEKKQEG